MMSDGRTSSTGLRGLRFACRLARRSRRRPCRVRDTVHHDEGFLRINSGAELYGMRVMAHEAREIRFLATPEKGEVSALLVRPGDASHLLVVGHGASTNMRHATLQTIAERLADVGIATFRYNFPYMEYGRGRDSPAVCTATVRAAVAAAHRNAPDLPLLAGGHSFGGRMTSTAAAESPLDGVHGLVSFAFPLHQPGKPDTKRAEHLGAVTVPMLFLSGTRDELADPDLLQPVCKKLGKRATLHPLDTADHGFRTLNRSRKSEEDVFVEMARIVREWASGLKRLS
jgi:predicted alpha/beta-hydrolase family hydrolase